MKQFFLVLLFSISFSNFLFGQNGLDKTFGTNGKKSIALTAESSNYVQNILHAIPDSLNRITLVANEIFDGGSNLIISRRLENGLLDTTFGSKGSFTIPISDSNVFYYDQVSLDPQGRIVFAGLNNTLFYDVVVSRYLPSGAIDTSFSHKGYTKYAWSNWGDYINSLFVQKDGKILVSGTVNAGYTSDFALMRLLPNGNLDSTFNDTGLQFLNIVAQDQNAILTVLPNGKYLLSGAYLSMDSAGLAMAQLNSNGTIDTTFGKKGFITWTYGRGDHYFIDMQVLANGKYLGIIKKPGEGSNLRVARFLQTGLIDTSFGTNGYNLHSMDPTQLIPDSLSGYYTCINRKIYRFNNNGSLDSTFGNHIIGTPNYDFAEHCNGGFLNFFIKLPNKTFRAFGGKALGTQEGHNGIAIITAFTKAGTYQYSFADSSILIFEGKKIEVLLPLKILSSKAMVSGELLIAGLTKLTYGDNLVVFKVDVNGNLVKNFGDAGMFKLPLSTLNNFKCDILELPTKEICIAYNKYQNGVDTTRVIKLDSMGRQDFTFGDRYSNAYYPNNGVFLNIHNNTILLSATGYYHLNYDGTYDQIYLGYGTLTPKMVMVDNRNRILLGFDSTLIRSDSMGVLDDKFADHGIFSYQHTYICNGKSYSANLKFNSITDDSVNKYYVIGGSIKRTCPTNYTEDIWIKVKYDGTLIGSKPLFTLGNFSGKTNEAKLLKNTYLVNDYWTPQAGNSPQEKGVVYKLNHQGTMDANFGNGGKLLAQEAMYKLTDSSSYLSFSKLEPIDNSRAWWIQGYNDSVYLNKIVVTDITPTLDFTSDSTTLHKPYSVKLTPTFNYPVKNYFWKISSSNGGQSNFTFGTDSSFESPFVLIKTQGAYDVELKVNYLDTSLTVLKKSYINFVKPSGLADLKLNDKVLVYPNPIKNELKLETELTGCYEISLFSLQGDCVYQNNFCTKEATISCTTMPLGVYFYVIKTDSQEIVKGKLIKIE